MSTITIQRKVWLTKLQEPEIGQLWTIKDTLTHKKCAKESKPISPPTAYPSLSCLSIHFQAGNKIWRFKFIGI